ncbi:hypothetical protein HYU92_02410 [Candidatus Curtissbacteria bacterium]|nr:hypothetical protein [Candidatus Curtissbacteria bacterium]
MKGIRIKGIERYSGQWVALDKTGTKVILGGKNLKSVMAKAVQKVDKPVYMKVPRLDAYFTP